MLNFKSIVCFLLFCMNILACNPTQYSDPNFSQIKPFESYLLHPLQKEKLIHGTWLHKWKNRDGYLVYEFVTVAENPHDSFTCVINAMGGYEFAPIEVKGNTLYTNLIDPQKNVYINQLSKYGRTVIDVALLYDDLTDSFILAENTFTNNKKNIFQHLNSTQRSDWDLFQSTCAKVKEESKKIDVKKIRFDKQTYSQSSAHIATLQTLDSTYIKGHYCVYNIESKTLLSLPLHQLFNGDMVFSNLDFLRKKDKEKYFTPTTLSEMAKKVPEEMLTLCSTLSKNAKHSDLFPEDSTFPIVTKYSSSNLDNSRNNKTNFTAGKHTQTYLTCHYSHTTNGSKAGWEWGEYPRWEWETQKQSCTGLSPSNCLQINGHWARDGGGLKAIGTMFLVDSSSKIEADFNRSCYETNMKTKQRDSRIFSRYYVADSRMSLNHTVWFKKTHVDNHYGLPFDRIIAFGDSLSDNGNLHTATSGLIAAGGYYQGRFTNGLVWVEQLSRKLGLDLYDWAVAAAPTALGNIFDLFHSMPYTLETEMINFTDAIDEVGISQEEISKTLFTLLIGGNNFVFDVRSSAEEIAADTLDFIDNLIYLGAKHILTVNLPDVGCAPKFSGSDCTSSKLRHTIIQINALLAKNIQERELRYPDVTFYKLNLFKITDDIADDPSRFSITNTRDKCYIGGLFEKYFSKNICHSPKTYMFWDELHPSASLHCQVSDHAMNAIFEKYNIPPVKTSASTPNENIFNTQILTLKTDPIKINDCASSFMY